MSSTERVPEQITLLAIETEQRQLTHDEAVQKWIAENPFHLRFHDGNFREVSVDFTTPGFDENNLVPIRDSNSEAA